MATEIRVPTLGESVTEATVGQWFKKEGEAVSVDEPLVELETDKVTVEVPAPISGMLESISVGDGETVEVGALLGAIAEGEAAAKGDGGSAKPIAAGPETPRPREEAKAEAPKAEAPPAVEARPEPASQAEMPPSPAARKALAEAGLSADEVAGSGRRGQILKEDVARVREAPPAPAPEPAPVARAPSPAEDEAREERVRMTRLRQTIARRLKDAQNSAAMLTTFNEVDMSAVMELRRRHRDLFEKKHGVRLGFMGFFIKACVHALHEVPEVNAEIDGADIVYKNYYHVGVAVGTDRGLVVPVVRDSDRLSFAEIEKVIGDFGRRARDGQLKLEEMQGGTFTITNGGIYGSLLSTPILNAPQSGILAMHRIEERPVARDGQVVVRPMMYLALSYDHRIVDGKDAVTFLVRVKEAIEDPERLLLDL
ncbi:MAG TPA: 2-oxoglutarate dehydrogenase complex dihydrolipoyllysine-residue succinyltransferase [Afifellaceae bacterium]|nr:2-oxoglutarate dehydrogenase complex dihydrolipoyllysine-residue succinyltransferase [Afifellaceae bacterium]